MFLAYRAVAGADVIVESLVMVLGDSLGWAGLAGLGWAGLGLAGLGWVCRVWSDIFMSPPSRSEN